MIKACAVFASSAALLGPSTAFAAGGWSAPTLLTAYSANGPQATLTSISCASASFCVVGADDNAPSSDNGLVFTYDGHAWSKARTVDFGGGGLSMSCPSASFCIAVDDHGNALSYDGRSWSAPVGIDVDADGLGVGLNSVSCPSPSFCMAVDGQGNALSYDGHSWSAPTTVAPATDLTQVSCASSSLCAAVEWKGSHAFVYRDGAWTEATIGSGVLYGVSCPSVSFCAALDDTFPSKVVIYNGSGWGTPVAIDPSYSDLEALSCASVSFCLATADTHPDYRYDGGSWKAENSAEVKAPITLVSCPSDSFCAGVDDLGDAYTYAPGSGPSTPRPQATIKTAKRRVALPTGLVTVKLGCARKGGACRGTLELSVRVGHTLEVIARRSYAVTPGGERSVVLDVSALGRTLLKSAPNHRLRVTATASVHGGRTATRVVVLYL